MIVLYDVYSVAHIVANEVEMTQVYERYHYLENWQVRTACAPDKKASDHLELWGRHPDIARARTDIDDVSLAPHPTCLACIGAQ